MRSLILMGASALAIAASPTFAAEDQETKVAQGAAEEAAAEMMVVTGSRIARENIDATVPITSLSAAELLQNGTVNVGDRLALLPQFRPSFTSQNRAPTARWCCKMASATSPRNRGLPRLTCLPYRLT